MTKRAIIAGKGVLPRLLAEATKGAGADPVVVDFGTTDLDWIDGYSVIRAKFEKSGAFFRALRREGVTEVVFGGGMERPKLNPIKMDRHFLSKAPQLLRAIRGGDDGLLRSIAAWFEEEGFTIVAPQDVVSDLIAPNGVWGRHYPSEQDDLDMDRGVQILEALAPQDVGQACVVSGGICFGIETIQGTDALLNFVMQTEQRLQPPPSTKQGVLVKLPKVGQEQRIDLPSIGTDTVHAAKAAGLSGIAVMENGALVLGLQDVVAAADEAQMFLMGLPDVDAS
ncbi:MAG: UDP-2,3-diacylglucosamine diphosphatase LpxI [Pseudomonadota bacterium]